ncbi:hypothetical protein AC578_701 [Pseudocercospora eumusae]|uniref:Uncharacterized protein n=1 Tax=Pseudocercospora eumusae TaxID=321146 RepID=A0A139HKT8_9PEZI|nr:hypothetical protein AC578_701 [Pseudocercospora eumusae]
MASDRNTVPLTPGVIVKATDTSIKSDQQQWPSNLKDVPIPALDTGVFLAELANINKLPSRPNYTDEERDAAHMNPESLFQKFQDIQISPIAEGTYRGTQLALTKIWQQIESSYASFMNTANFEPSIPHPLTIEQKREAFSFTDPASDGYPPHLNLAGNRAISDMNPGEWQRSTMTRTDLFNKMRLAQMTALLPQLIPKRKWIVHFLENATQSDSDQRMKSKIQSLVLNDPDALYMQDYSDFREGAGLALSQDMKYSYTEYYESGLGKMAKENFRYSVAAVCLFHLQPDGQLQPLAIVCDWRGSAAKSVSSVQRELQNWLNLLTLRFTAPGYDLQQRTQPV